MLRSGKLKRSERGINAWIKGAEQPVPRVTPARIFAKRTQWATLLARERYPDYGEAPPHCRGMAGDKASARTAQGGRVSEAKYERPVLTGYGRGLKGSESLLSTLIRMTYDS